MLLKNKLLLIVLLCFSSTLLSTEKNAPIHIEADTVELDEKTGTSTYSGNVKLTQANLSINSEKIMVFVVEKNLQKMIATGSPAIFTQAHEQENMPPITAQAKKIEYDAVNNSLSLYDEVQLKQGENSILGDIIFYDIQNNIVKAEGKKESSRVKATIQLDDVKR